MSSANVGGLLRRARLRLGLTLRDVASAVGVSIAYVSDVELGRRALAPKRLSQFVETLSFTEGERAAAYRALGYLPDGAALRLLKAPELWAADFGQLKLALTKALTALDASGFTDVSLEVRRALQWETISRREKAVASVKPRSKELP